MKIWNQIAHLSVLKLTQKESSKLISQVQSIISFFNQISDVSTDHVRPMISPSEDFSAFREDTVIKTKEPQKLIDQAPRSEKNFIKSPQIIS